jgi:hypothetical protein
MAARCARDVGDFAREMTGFCMFYRALCEQARAGVGVSSDPGNQRLSLLPRVCAATRAEIVKRIDAIGSQVFARETIEELERTNAELLLMAHNFADGHRDYGGVIQGFALLYACLLAEAIRERGILH